MLTPHGRRDRNLTLHVGATVAGKYRIKRLLGQGGMGAVYKAENTAIGRTVALKVLHPHLADDETTLARFQREARAAASIGHRHVVDVLDLGVESSGAPFLVMEYVRGKSLSKVLRTEGPIDPRRAAQIAGQILDGLAAVHAAGIVHRDLKPENVFLTVSQGRADFVKIFDFGVATFLESAGESGQRDLTPTGRAMGTPYYASPEQLRGEPGRDQRVDLYSVGVMLYELVCGERPYQADGFVNLCQMILYQDLPPMAVFRKDVPPAFEALVRKALSKHPGDRFESAMDMAYALVPHGAEPVVTDEPEPTDTFTIDLRELRERERLAAPDAEGSEHGRHVSGKLLIPARAYLRETLGEAAMAELLAGTPAEVHARFVGPILATDWYGAEMVRVLERADDHFGRGDRALLAGIGRRVAFAFVGGGALEDVHIPEMALGKAAELWPQLYGSGLASVPKVGHGYGLIEVTGQVGPRLAGSITFVGIVDEFLRASGAKRVEVRLVRAVSLGDPEDVFEASWSA
jgi:serine/threonine protein kinase